MTERLPAVTRQRPARRSSTRGGSTRSSRCLLELVASVPPLGPRAPRVSPFTAGYQKAPLDGRRPRLSVGCALREPPRFVATTSPPGRLTSRGSVVGG